MAARCRWTCSTPALTAGSPRRRPSRKRQLVILRSAFRDNLSRRRREGSQPRTRIRVDTTNARAYRQRLGDTLLDEILRCAQNDGSTAFVVTFVTNST